MTATTDQKSANPYRTLNPATGELVREFAVLSEESAEAALARAHAAFTSWRRTSIADRVALYRRFAHVIEEHTEELGRLVVLEMGKTLPQAIGEVGLGATMFRYYADNAEHLLADRASTLEGFQTTVTRLEPLGVVLGIEPWNAPIYQALRVAAPNLMLGNTVLLKPAEITAGSTIFLDGLFAEAGFPPNLFQTVLISIDQAAAYIADARVRAVTLTGSDRAGAAVGEQASRAIKPVVLELGGSDPFIVLDSADPVAAAQEAAARRLRISGQVCVSPKRLIVTEKVADQFIETFVNAFGQQTVGDPFDPDTTVGPLSSQEAAALLQEQYEDALANGAEVLVPGGRIDGAGAFFTPAVITGVTPDMRLYREEAFGPLGVIYRVQDANAAVELANGSDYGLSGTVFARDLDEAHDVASRLDTGGVGINAFLGAPVQVPFGGTKRSGVGRELGPSGMEQFANIKTYATA